MTKIGTEVAHVTRDSDTTFNVKGQGSRSPGRFGWLYWQANMDIKLVTDPDACMMYIVSLLAGLGGDILSRPPAYSLLYFRRQGVELLPLSRIYRDIWFRGALQNS